MELCPNKTLSQIFLKIRWSKITFIELLEMNFSANMLDLNNSGQNLKSTDFSIKGHDFEIKIRVYETNRLQDVDTLLRKSYFRLWRRRNKTKNSNTSDSFYLFASDLVINL
jgi:hypothetical protein